MDLSAWLLRHTPPRPLVVTAPRSTGARVAAERVVRERGWRPAWSPAEANILVVAGGSSPAVEPHLRRVWNAIPAPRARADVTGPADVARRLDSAVTALRDADGQRRGSPGQATGGAPAPGSIPMADRSEDRDGLTLDELHVPLGPLLTSWPAGLVVHTRLQGDVVRHAEVDVLDGVLDGHGSPWTAGNGAARRLDSAARLLALAGWADASVTAQRLRDEAIAGADPPPRLARWAARVRRSRTLRWLLAGVGSIPDGPAALTGDALTRLYRWLDPAAGPPTRHDTQWAVDNLPALLTGTELATARLVVASLDPDLDLLGHREDRHG